MWGEDDFTSTVEGAAAHARGLGDWDDDRPTAADLAADEAEAYYEGPEDVEHGIRCGACKGRHETVGNVRWCYDLRAEMEAEAAAEQAAEAASELAFARSLEARAENGTWFGPQTEADRWGE